MSPPDRRQATPVKPVRGPSGDGVLVVDVDRLLISGPAVVAILQDNRPVFRPRDFTLMRVRMLLPQAQMAEDALLRPVHAPPLLLEYQHYPWYLTIWKLLSGMC
jgi:hypothetical protein